MSGIFDSLRRFINPTEQAPDHPANRPLVSAVKDPKPKPDPSAETVRQDPYREKPAPAAPPPQVYAPVADAEPEPDLSDIDVAKGIVDTCNESDPEFAKAFDTVLAHAETIADLRWLFGETATGNSSEARVLDKLKGLDLNFDDWNDACVEENDANAWSGICFSKAIATAKTDDDWVALWGFASDHDEMLAKLKEEMIGAGWTEDEWASLRDEAESGGSLENFAFVQILSFKKTPQDIIRFYLDYCEDWSTDDDVVEAIFDKLFGLTTRQEAQIVSALAGEDDALRDAADEFLRS